MKEVSINSWAEYVAQVEKLQAKRNALAAEASFGVSVLLYRGQPDAKMRLETTLEREVKGFVTLADYYQFVSIIKSRIESVTGKNWAIASYSEFRLWLSGSYPPYSDHPSSEFLAYLRHHGLPSPLLDWSRSAYVAALFAMQFPPRLGVENVSVYTYLESTGIKGGDVDAPAIQSFCSNMTTHKRHYLQQSEYTICTSGKGNNARYASHDAVFEREDAKQDLLWKLTIPVSERRIFIEHLQQMNVTPYSLFQTEDKLMEDLWLSEEFQASPLRAR